MYMRHETIFCFIYTSNMNSGPTTPLSTCGSKKRPTVAIWKKTKVHRRDTIQCYHCASCWNDVRVDGGRTGGETSN